MRGKGGTLTITHGTAYGYTRGCRCEPCVTWKRAYERIRAQRRRGEPVEVLPPPPPVPPTLVEAPPRPAVELGEAVEREEPDVDGACLRCGDPERGYPLCETCVLELRGERTSELAHDEYIHRAADMFLRVPWNASTTEDVLVSLLENEVACAVGKAPPHVGMARDLEHHRHLVEPELAAAWGRDVIRYVGWLGENLPVR